MNQKNETITYGEWLKKGEKLFGENKAKWKFVCCNCGNVQSIEDFEKHNIESPETKVYFSCIGRWTGGKGELGNKEKPCNYTVGGLLDISQLKIIKDKNEISAFKFADNQIGSG